MQRHVAFSHNMDGSECKCEWTFDECVVKI